MGKKFLFCTQLQRFGGHFLQTVYPQQKLVTCSSILLAINSTTHNAFSYDRFLSVRSIIHFAIPYAVLLWSMVPSHLLHFLVIHSLEPVDQLDLQLLTIVFVSRISSVLYDRLSILIIFCSLFLYNCVLLYFMSVSCFCYFKFVTVSSYYRYG